MSSGGQPLADLWWLVNRASGIVALVLISVSVMLGLAMAARALQRPAFKRAAARLHEHVALTALLAIGAHGLALLGDRWLNPGWQGITVPFALSYRPQFTGAGIIAGYLALVLGPSFYLRRRIGARRWRRLHGLIVVTWLLSVVHTLGSGSDAKQLWLRAIVVFPGIGIVYLLTLRLLKPSRAPATRARSAQDRARDAAEREHRRAGRHAGASRTRLSAPADA